MSTRLVARRQTYQEEHRREVLDAVRRARAEVHRLADTDPSTERSALFSLPQRVPQPQTAANRGPRRLINLLEVPTVITERAMGLEPTTSSLGAR